MADLRAQLAWRHAFRSQVRLQGELDALRSKMVGSLRLIAGDTVVLTESLCCLQVIMAVAPQRQRSGTPRFIVDMAFLHCNPPSSATELRRWGTTRSRSAQRTSKRGLERNRVGGAIPHALLRSGGAKLV